MLIKGIKILNLKCFENMSIDFIAPDTNETLSTAVLVGENGVGKSTILKAIAHCLSIFCASYGGKTFDSSDIQYKKNSYEIEVNVEFNDDENNFIDQNLLRVLLLGM